MVLRGKMHRATVMHASALRPSKQWLGGNFFLFDACSASRITSSVCVCVCTCVYVRARATVRLVVHSMSSHDRIPASSPSSSSIACCLHCIAHRHVSDRISGVPHVMRLSTYVSIFVDGHVLCRRVCVVGGLHGEIAPDREI